MTALFRVVIILNTHSIIRPFLIILVLLSFLSCNNDNDSGSLNTIEPYGNFKTIDLDFSNTITDDSLSVFDYHYLYNGGGVGVADFNSDGYKDIFLTGNLVSSALLIGDAELNFKNITESAGITTHAWINGVSIVDINHDGRSDIYLSVGGPDCNDADCNNLLYINYSENDIIRFSEESEQYALNINGYSQQALFFDADLDGDLDMYQLQNYVDPTTKNYPKQKRYYSKKSYDKFYINQEVETGVIKYQEASQRWGIDAPGFGLGIACSDINNDGYPDLYIANDFISDDILYINQKGKKFVDESKSLLKHTSYNSMGVDIADLNGDLYTDIMVVDMLPSDNHRQKTMLGNMNYDKHLLSLKAGYNKQYIRNTVQISGGSSSDIHRPFAEVSQNLGLHETDWSWAPLILDINNDTKADVYISNGYGKNITDLDFVNYNSGRSGFGNPEDIRQSVKDEIRDMPNVALYNVIFLQDQNRKYNKIYIDDNNITNGVAYADIDNDGDIDFIQNKINAPANIVINPASNNYLTVQLTGPSLNKDAIGAEVIIELSDGQKQRKDMTPVRSYLSTMDTDLVFGIGGQSVKNIIINWPDKTSSIIDTIIQNASIVIDYYKEDRTPRVFKSTKNDVFLQDTIIQRDSHIRSNHDFSIQSLLFKSCITDNIRMVSSSRDRSIIIANLSTNIQALSTKSNKLTDIYDVDGYIVSDLLLIDDESKLVITLIENSEKNKITKVLVLNRSINGWGIEYQKELNAGIYSIAFDGGQIYLYRSALPQDYPDVDGQSIYTIKSSIDKKWTLEPSKFDVTGNISDIVVADIDADGLNDIIITGEWMSPRIFISDSKDDYTELSYPSQDSLYGLWQDISIVDIDNDGDNDIAISNIGTNTRLRTDFDNPIYIVDNDMDGDGSIDPVMSYYNISDGNSYSYVSRDNIMKHLPTLKQKFSDYSSFSSAQYQEIIASFDAEPSTKYINCLSSVILENVGDMKFRIRYLPAEAQLSSINNMIFTDINGDNLKDIIALTNIDHVEITNGSFDALNSLVMINKSNLTFEVLSSSDSGLYIAEEAEDILDIGAGVFYISTSEAVYSIVKNVKSK